MTKLITYILIVSGIMLLFHYTGIIGSTEGSPLFNILLHPENISDLEPTTQLILALQGIAGAGLIALGFITGQLELAVVAPLAIYFYNLILDMLVIYSKVASYSTPFAVLIFAAPILVFVIVIIDWWRGRG